MAEVIRGEERPRCPNCGEPVGAQLGCEPYCTNCGFKGSCSMDNHLAEGR